MGLSNMLQGGSGGADAGGATSAAPATGDSSAAAPHKSFGDKLGDYFKNRYPIAGGLASAVFDPSQTAAPAVAANPAPQAQILPGDQPDYSQMIGMNAMPRQGGGLAAILKLLA